MDLFTIRELLEPGTFSLEGELDMASAGVLLSRVNGGPKAGDLVLDLSGLTFMDSSGLRAILQLARRNHGSSVILRHPTPPVARVLEIAIPGGVPGVRIEEKGIDAS